MQQVALKHDVIHRWTDDEIRELNEHFSRQSPEALLDWATATFAQDVVLTCSFGGPSGMVLLDMLASIGRDTPVVFLDTGLLFPETYALVEQIEQRYGTLVRRQLPALSLHEQERQEGPELYKRDPDRCCGIRKVTPLREALHPYAAWITGVRRDQSATRATAQPVQWNNRYNLLKMCPLAYWSEGDVWAYLTHHNVPYNTLLDQG
jgi:phosphoadenosine phosphosulfate reductase